MMMDDKKKRATLIIGKLKKPEMQESPTNEMGDEVDDSMPKEAAAEELIAAIQSGSAKGVAEAVEALMELCGSKSED